MLFISYIVNHKPQRREGSSRMFMHGVNKFCFKMES